MNKHHRYADLPGRANRELVDTAREVSIERRYCWLNIGMKKRVKRVNLML